MRRILLLRMVKCRWLLILACLSNLFAAETRAATSWFQQLGTLRFGDERVVRAVNGQVDLGDLSDNEFLHVQGEILFFPGEFIEPHYFSAEEFEKLVAAKNPIDYELSLKPNGALLAIEGAEQNYGTFLMRFTTDRPIDLMIGMTNFEHPAEVFLINQDMVYRWISVDQVDPNPDKNRNFVIRNARSMRQQIDGDFYLLAHVSSPLVLGKNTLSLRSFLLGPTNYLAAIMSGENFALNAVYGGLLAMTIFYFFVFLFRSQDQSSLYVALYSLTSFLLAQLHIFPFFFNAGQVAFWYTIVNLSGVCALQHFLIGKLEGKILPKHQLYSKLIFASSAESMGVFRFG